MTLQIINSQSAAIHFILWLAKHPEIINIQGWPLRRNDNGIAIYFGTHYADAAWLWQERSTLNDWIRSYHTKF